MREYDLVIIGSGSGNTIIDERYAHKQIALCEQGIFGGTCLNVGCIPTKMFVYAADVARSVTSANRYGLDAQLMQVHWPEIVRRVFDRIDPISAAGHAYRQHASNIDVYDSHARFETIDSEGRYVLYTDAGERFCARQVVIAAGSRPMIPDVIRESSIPYYTSDTIMRIPQLPSRLVIIGGGFIAAEFAHVFSAMGVNVSIIIRGDRLLERMDQDISHRFTRYGIDENHWSLYSHAQVIGATQSAHEICLHLDNGSVVHADTVLVATGRIPNGDRLDGHHVGIAMHEGKVLVDEYQRTSARNVFALGDVSSPYELKHVANHEARVVQHNLLCPWDDTAEMVKANHQYVPFAVFSHPQLASVGLTEQDALAQGYAICVAIQEYKDVAYGWAMEDHYGFVKLIADSQRCCLLGAHIMGYQASVLIQSLIQAMNQQIPLQELARGQYWIHPALSEVIENALLKFDCVS